MSATPFADQRTTAGDTFMGRSRIIYNFGFCKPLCIPTVYPLIPRVPMRMPPLHRAPLPNIAQSTLRNRNQ